MPEEEFEDLIGDGPQLPNLPPTSAGYKKHVDKKERELEHRMEERRRRMGVQKVSLLATDMHAGVTVGWLSEVFHLDPATVRKRLADCPPVSTHKTGYRYSLPAAAAFLVKPIFDVKKYLKNMRAEELPAHLQAQFWDGQNKKQKWEENAGDLWRTEAVMEVFSDVFLTIKSTAQLWTEDLERTTGLTPKQRASLSERVDALQNEIREKLLNLKVGAGVHPAILEVQDQSRAILAGDGSELI